MDSHFISSNPYRIMVVPKFKHHIPALILMALSVVLFVFMVRSALVQQMDSTLLYSLAAGVTLTALHFANIYRRKKSPTSTFNYVHGDFRTSLSPNLVATRNRIKHLGLTSTILTSKGDSNRGTEVFRLHLTVEPLKNVNSVLGEGHGELLVWESSDRGEFLVWESSDRQATFRLAREICKSMEIELSAPSRFANVLHSVQAAKPGNHIERPVKPEVNVL